MVLSIAKCTITRECSPNFLLEHFKVTLNAEGLLLSLLSFVTITCSLFIPNGIQCVERVHAFNGKF